MALGHARARRDVHILRPSRGKAPESDVPSQNDYNSRGGKAAAVKPIFPNNLDSQ
jgi:hypothetical protein